MTQERRTKKQVGTKDPFDWFTLFTFIIGAIGYTPWVLSSYGLLPSLPLFVLIGGLSPVFGATLAALKCYGKRGAYYNFRQVTLCTKTSVLWVVVAFALPLLEAFLLILSYSLFIAPLKLASITWFAFLPALIGNFFIAMGEEFG